MKLTSQEENYLPGKYELGKQQVGGSAEDLLLCRHEPPEQGAQPGKIINSQAIKKKIEASKWFFLALTTYATKMQSQISSTRSKD